MVTLTPQIVVASVTALATWERQRKAKNAKDRPARVNKKRGEASVRFVHFIGFWSHYTPGRHSSSWPLPLSTSIKDLAGFGEQHRVVAPSPRAGDIFLLASVRDRQHAIAGIVVEVETVTKMLNGRPAFICVTAEGEVEGAVGSPRIAKARLVRRRLSPVYGDCFIRWCDLPVRVSLAEEGGRTTVRYEMPKDLLTFKRNHRRRAA